MRSRGAALLAASAMVLGGCGYAGLRDVPLPGGPEVGKRPYTVTAQFEDVLNLATESTVRADGVTVGRVDSITRDGWQAVVTLRLQRDVELPANVRARVAQTSLLGEKYVDLQAPQTPRGVLAEGDEVELARTSSGTEVEEVLGALSMLLNGGGIAQLRTVTQELHLALDEDSGDARRFLRELDEFVGTLDSNREVLIDTLENVDRLTRTVREGDAIVDEALDEIGPGVQALADQRRELVRMLEDVSSFGDVASDVVRRAGADLEADLAALRPVLAELESYGQDLPRALAAALNFPFPEEVMEIVKGDYTNLDVTVNVSPLGTLGAVLGTQEPGNALVDLVPGLTPPVPDVPESGRAPLPVPGVPGQSAGPTPAPSAPAAPRRGLLDLFGGRR